ncbi:MAG: S41 family peptidase, partial [Acidobacteriota bacterium]
VGYVRINRFSRFMDGNQPRPVQYDALDAALAEMRGDFSAVSRIIVDVAMNGGGSDAAAQIVASYFADRRRPVLRYEVEGAPTREIVVSPRADGERRPILLLTSEVTASAAESFVLMMRAFPHVTQVGGATRGGLSSLLPKPFPNGFRVTFSYQRVLDAEGNLFEGMGVPPERPVELFPDTDVHGGFAAALSELSKHTLVGQVLLPSGSGSRGVEVLVTVRETDGDSQVWVRFDEQGRFSQTFRGAVTSLWVTAGIGAEVFRIDAPEADEVGRVDVGVIDLRDRLRRHRMVLRAAEGKPGGDVRMGMWFGPPPTGPGGELASLGSSQFPTVVLGSEIEWLLSPEAESIYFLVERPAGEERGPRWRTGHQRLFGPFTAAEIPAELVMD